MSLYNASQQPSPFEMAHSQLLSQNGLRFSELLPEQALQDAFDKTGANDAANEDDDDDIIFTPAITLWGFLSQMLFKQEQRSCVAAVARIAVLLIAIGREPCAADTAAYCRARFSYCHTRLKLKETVIEHLVLQVATKAEAALPAAWLWKNRHVKLVDGTTMSLPDTAENQKIYPQQNTQQPGLGFPTMRVVVLISLATAMVGGVAFAPYAGKQTGETALLRTLLSQFDEGDILLADRYYCSYFMIALLLQHNVDFVARLHQLRPKSNARDAMQTWKRPRKPKWMDQETYNAMPKSIRIRLLNVRVTQPGYRVKNLSIATTLSDKQEYSCDEICDLYHQRWHVELDIRSIKCTMGLDVLRCKTPEMARKEALVGVLMYNLIRQTILQAAQEADVSPRHLSFTAAMQQTAAFWEVTFYADEEKRQSLIATLLHNVSQHRVGNRPGRAEPRAKKRRPKNHKLLTDSREEARRKLLQG